MLDMLSERIWANPRFHSEFRDVVERHLQATVLGADTGELGQDVVVRLARSAAIMSGATGQLYRNAAYRIAVALTSLCGEAERGAAEIMLLVLNRLGNFPASEFAKARYGVSPLAFPASVAVEAELHRQKNSAIVGKVEFQFTDFQSSLWEQLNNTENVSVSAPTSAGKSFVVQAFLRNGFEDNRIKQAAYIVPSRALINQVATEVSNWIGQIGEKAPELFTVPFAGDQSIPDRAIYVMTQERFQLVQASHQDLRLDVMVSDEVQGIGEGPRGILLSSVIEEAITRNKQLKLLFAGPNLANPDHLGGVFGIGIHPVKTLEPTVSQNLFYVQTSESAEGTDLAPGQLSLSHVNGNEVTPLGVATMSHPITRELDKFIHIPATLGKAEQSLVYVNGPAFAETVANGISDILEEIESEELQALSALAAECVHPAFSLVDTAKKGIGFHYGRLPAVLRQGLERAFGTGHLRLLVTTSTLLQGVNLPAKNLFLYKPERGQGKPLTSIDFWNLAGRAGRLGKEFEGNVFLIDYDMWDSKPLDGQREEIVISSLERHVAQNTDELLGYILNTNLAATVVGQDEYENTFVKLFSDHQKGTLPNTLGRLGISPTDTRYKELESALVAVEKKTTLTSDTIAASPTVSVYRQQALYERLIKSARRRGPNYVVPKHPQSKDGYASLTAILKRCHDELFNYAPTDKSYLYWTMIAYKWMRGEGIPQIIDGSYDFAKRQGKNPNLATVIRQVLGEIERDLRFKYVRALSCYTSVLRQALTDIGREDLVKTIPPIGLYMEVGAVNQTMISLMGIGVSRYTAGRLQAIMGRTDMGQPAVRQWLLTRNLRGLDIPAASVNELLSMRLAIS